MSRAPSVFLSLVALLLAAGVARADTEAKLTGFDALARLNRNVNLVAKLERKGVMGIDPDVEGASLDFFVTALNGVDRKKPEFLGTGTSDGDGLASVEWKPTKPGSYTIQARVRRGSEYSAAPATLSVAVPDEGRPIVLVQIDGTVSKATNLKLFRGTKNDEIQVEEGSKDMLQLLGEHHQLVYLTDLELSFANKFKEWLALREIPSAPVFFWELFERSLSHKTYMTKVVESLRKRFPTLRAGIGGKVADGEAFAENGLVGIVLDPTGEEELPDTVVHAESWQHAYAHVLQAHRARGLLTKVAGGGKDGKAAVAALSIMGRAGIGYTHPYANDSDVGVASAALLVMNKLRACRTFRASLDLSSANRARNSLIAAWRYGELLVVRELYADKDLAKSAKVESFDTLRLVSRNEPEPGKVVYELELSEGGKARKVKLSAVEQDDKSWRIGE